MLRATRETELMAIYPGHVVCKWIGNSRAIAQKHYLQVTDEDYAKAATQNPTQQAAISTGIEVNDAEPLNQNHPVFPSDSAAFSSVQDFQWAVQGSNL